MENASKILKEINFTKADIITIWGWLDKKFQQELLADVSHSYRILFKSAMPTKFEKFDKQTQQASSLQKAEVKISKVGNQKVGIIRKTTPANEFLPVPAKKDTASKNAVAKVVPEHIEKDLLSDSKMKEIEKQMIALAKGSKPAKRTEPVLKVEEPKKVDFEINKYMGSNYKYTLSDAIKALTKAYKTAPLEEKAFINTTILNAKAVLDSFKTLKRKKIISHYLQ